MSPFNEYRYFLPSRPRKVEGGLKARSSRGSIGETWWSRRFVDVIESFALGTRLTRGRNYARAGQVISLEVKPGEVSAQVQGSRPRPYTTKIEIDPFRPAVWQRIEAGLAQQALFSAQLLAGEMPQDLEPVFAAAGVSLFPRSVRELGMRCSCPDSAVPCKHLAATLYLLAEFFDEDPFQILYWRGKAREQLLTRLRELRGTAPDNADRQLTGAGPTPTAGPTPAAGVTETAAADAGKSGTLPAGVTEHLERFWVPARSLPPLPTAVPTDPDLVLRQLPEPSRRLGGAKLVEQLRPAFLRFERQQPPE